jgi:hypothetical protein
MGMRVLVLRELRDRDHAVVAAEDEAAGVKSRQKGRNVDPVEGE